MAGGVDSNWASATNWSTVSSAGPNDTTKATASDDAIFDAGSPACTVNAAEGARTLTSTNYASTMTIDATRVLTLQNFTSTLGGTIAGTGTIKTQTGTVLNGTATSASTVTLDVTTGAVTLKTGANCIWGNISQSTGVITLTGNIYTKDATISTLWGTYRLYVQRNLSGSSLSGTSGTPVIVMNGTGTFGASGGMNIGINVEIDTAGTCTFGADVRFGSSNKIFKYITGTVDSSAGVVGCFAAFTFNTSGMTFHNMTVTSASLVVQSELKVTTFTANASVVMSGAYPLTFGTCIIPAGKGLTMVTGTAMTVGALYMTGNDAINSSLTTASGTVNVTYTGAEDGYRIMWGILTRVVFIGRKLYNWWGTNTTVTNCTANTTYQDTRLVMPQLVGV